MKPRVLSGKINLGEINLSKQLVGESNFKTVKGTEKKIIYIYIYIYKR